MKKMSFAVGSQTPAIPSRRALCLGLGATIMGVAGGAGEALAQAARKTMPATVKDPAAFNGMSLNGDWQFALGGTPAEADALGVDFFKPEYNAAGFKSMPVPSNWVMHGFDKPQYRDWKGFAPEGFYLKRFNAPESWKDRRIVLNFDGVFASAEVWVNGQIIGRVDNGFNRISFVINKALNYGAENLLAVRVRQKVDHYELDTNDDWALGGIYRDVTLETMPGLRWLDRIETHTEFDDTYRDADLKVRVMVGDTNKRKLSTTIMNQGEPYVLRLSLFDATGKIVQVQDADVLGHDGSSGETEIAMRVLKPLHWNAETPNLYKLHVEIVEKGAVTHTRAIKIGFREISTKGGIFRINGQAIKLRGTNRHDEHPDVGRATRREHWLEDLALMKAGNINYIRLAHYVPASGFLDLCDEMGVYTSNEVSFGFGGDELQQQPDMSAAVLDRAYQTVLRDINHPSVVIWSIGNEDPLSTLSTAALRTVKALDPSRPVLLPLRADKTLPKEVDILAPHYWKTRRYDDEAGRADKPIVTTEFSHAYGVEGFGGFEDRWTALTRHAAGTGGAMWLWADQGLMLEKKKADGTVEKALNLPSNGFDGIVDAYRKPTRDYWESKAVYAQVYPGIDTLDFAPGQSSVLVPIQNDFDFTDLSKIKIVWQLMEDDRQLATATTSINGVPHAAQTFEVPLAGLKAIRPGATYYLWFTFLREDGGEISKRTVELRPTQIPEIRPVILTPTVAKTAATVTVTAGTNSYVFDTSTGQLVSASRGGKVQIGDVRPTIWRPLNHTETLKMSEKRVDLNIYKATVTDWKVNEGEGKVSIHAEVTYVVDADNSFKAVYNYDVNPGGTLSVRYSLLPTVKATWLPHVGVDIKVPSGADRLRWLGLGPIDAYSNMKMAANLGVYSEKLVNLAEDSMKATRWVEVSAGTAPGVRLDHRGYVRYRPSQPDRLLVLSSVIGRQTKADPPEPPYLLETNDGKPYVGAFEIELYA
ncbi:MAG: glycoside hydrolase family 2 TIM barrel-domain containing protein [Asticcacaulis sp.]